MENSSNNNSDQDSSESSSVSNREECEVESAEEYAEELETLRKALKEEREKTEDYLNRLKYFQADFENFKKRMERERVLTIALSNERLITNLLSVIDELELAVQAGEAGDKATLLNGVKMTLKNLYETLSHEGLTVIESVGKPFDPGRHEAIEGIPAEGHAEGVILEEVRKGFMLKGKVIRPSIVKVAVSATASQEG